MPTTPTAMEIAMARSAGLVSRQSHATPLEAAVQPVVKSSVEREIKLAVDDQFRLPHLPGAQLPRRLLTSTYYDTPSYDLTHAGITLRQRVEHGTYKWQLKLPLITDRQELEILDRQPAPPTAFRDLLILHIGRRPLTSVATLRTRRTGVRVCRDNLPIADVSLDDVSVVKHGAVIQRFRELEVEQINGEDTALGDLEHQLRQAGADDHDGRPKLFRALALPAPDSNLPPEPNAPVLEHVKWALGRHVRWLVAHDPGTRLGREPESLHQMRVATRKIRAVLHAAKPLLIPEWVDSLQKEVAWLTQVLGPARDLDVQLSYFRSEATNLAARDRQPLMRFVQQLESQRTQVQKVVLRELTSARYFDLVGRLRTAAQDPSVVESTVTLHDLATREFKKLRKAICRVGASPSSATVHKIRIKTKRARYTAELEEPTIGKPARRFIKKARALQDMLGMHQDAIQAEGHVRAFLKHSTSVRAGFVAGRMVERQRKRREQARSQMRKLWKGLLKRGKQAWG